MKYMFDAYISVMKAARDAIMSFNIIAWKIYSYLPSVMAWKVQSVISFWLLEQNDNHLETGITSVADKSHPCMTLMDAKMMCFVYRQSRPGRVLVLNALNSHSLELSMVHYASSFIMFPTVVRCSSGRRRRWIGPTAKSDQTETVALTSFCTVEFWS